MGTVMAVTVQHPQKTGPMPCFSPAQSRLFPVAYAESLAVETQKAETQKVETPKVETPKVETQKVSRSATFF